MSTGERWVVIPRWGEFQHYKDRDPKWIKVYPRLLADDDFLDLTDSLRGLLLVTWLEYARSGGLLATHRLLTGAQHKNRRRQLERLSEAGWIEITDSRPLALRYRSRVARAHSREGEEREPSKEGSLSTTNAFTEAAPSSTTPQRAASSPSGADGVSPFEQARAFVRNAGHLDPQLDRTLREDRPELSEGEVERLVAYAEELKAE